MQVNSSYAHFCGSGEVRAKMTRGHLGRKHTRVLIGGLGSTDINMRSRFAITIKDLPSQKVNTEQDTDFLHLKMLNKDNEAIHIAMNVDDFCRRLYKSEQQLREAEEFGFEFVSVYVGAQVKELHDAREMIVNAHDLSAEITGLAELPEEIAQPGPDAELDDIFYGFPFLLEMYHGAMQTHEILNPSHALLEAVGDKKSDYKKALKENSQAIEQFNQAYPIVIEQYEQYIDTIHQKVEQYFPAVSKNEVKMILLYADFEALQESVEALTNPGDYSSQDLLGLLERLPENGNIHDVIFQKAFPGK